MDNQIKELESKITNIEKSKQFKADQEAIQKVQMDMLLSLRSIREVMVASSKSGVGGGSETSSKELASLKEENEKLKLVNKKQAYRINHLVTNMEKLL
mmetsp:Transcript_32847/g.38246  ORF Transcript_32847/g.38246 Transcript_32847/m.38246 type:complete len:98 (+) Transcript_32847:137-430(+)